MKGIVLAGGTGSRLFPSTKVTNKHLLPIGKFPMIYYPIYKLQQCGITEIIIVTGKEHMGSVVNLLGSGYEFGLEFTYRIQDQPGGIAQALSLAEGFVGNDCCVVILGDNIFKSNIGNFVENYQKQLTGAKILIKRVPDPHRYGVAELKGDLIVGIEEKPQIPKSDYCVTGIYMYDSNVFKIIRSLKPSSRGELEITDVNNAYIEKGTLTYDIIDDWWTDAGTFESIFRANEYARGYDIGQEWPRVSIHEK
jgi:glucose-1-phosphate thymidylyltransferase